MAVVLPRNKLRRVAGKAALGLSATIALLTVPAAYSQAPAAAAPGTMVEAIARQLAGEYARQQMQRLAKKGDRDSLIAAALIGMPNDSRALPAEGHAQVLQRLVDENAGDALALYTAALVCSVQAEPCTQPQYQAQLLKLPPDNAIHFLLVPRGGKLDAAQLHLAAAVGKADTHFSDLLGIVGTALANQPALETAGASADADALALALRRNEVGSVPWPNLVPVIELCTAEAATRQQDEPQLHADCPILGLALFTEASHNLVSRSYGGTLIRRFARDSPAAAEALVFRREYVWISEQREPAIPAEKELFNEEAAKLGEWEAMQRHAERAGATRVPPDDWVAKDPGLLLLPEQREKK